MNTLRHIHQPHPVLADHERQRCEIWTRVMGYHRPVSSFNTGKKGEFAERVYFRETVPSGPTTQTQEDCV